MMIATENGDIDIKRDEGQKGMSVVGIDTGIDIAIANEISLFINTTF